jgi:4-amino-4-deoxy-L-arabinose transferase-like glycosyltransferase
MGVKRSSWKISGLPASRRFLGGVLAIALALAGQYALLANRVPAAALGYGLAIVVLLTGLAFPGIRSRSGRPAASESEGPEVPGAPAAARSGRLLLLGVVVSSSLIAASGMLVWNSPRSRQVLPAVLWGLGLLLFVLVFRGRPRRTDTGRLLACPSNDDFAPGVAWPRQGMEAFLAASMLLLAAVLRFHDLEYHPGIFGDEGERGMDARAILEGRPAPFFGSGWAGIPNLYYTLAAAMLRLFGDGLFGLRMLSALSGLVTVFLIYRTGRLLWGPRAGLLAGTFLAASPLALQFSRLAGESTPTGALWAAGFFFLFRTLCLGALRDASLSGVSFGLGLYFYPSGKLAFLLLPALCAYLLLVGGRRYSRQLFSRLSVLLIAFLLTFFPYAVSSSRGGWNAFSARYRDRAIFAPRNRPEAFSRAGLSYNAAWQGESVAQSFARHPLLWGRVLFTQMRDSLEVLFVNADPTAFYNIREHRGSMLSPAMAALTLLGLAFATAKVLDPRLGLLSLWFWGGLLGPALTLDTPSVQRLTGAWPAAMLLPAALLDRIAASSWPLGVSFARRWVNVALGALLVIVTTQGVREYFVHYRSLVPYADSTTQARYAQTLGTTYKAYQLGVGDGLRFGDVFFSYGSTRFLAKGVEGADVTALSDILPVTDETKKGVVFLVRDSNAESLPILRSVYPGGQEEVVRSSDGIPRFTAYKLGPARIAGFHTLRTTYTQADGRTVERDEPNLGTLPAGRPDAAWRPPQGLSYPARVLWEGSLVAPAYGRYRFTLSGQPGARLSLDEAFETAGQGVSAASPKALELLLARGLHHVRLSGLLGNPESQIVVASAFEAEAAQPIARRYLFRESLGGLTGEVWTDTPARLPSLPAARPSVRRVDPAIGFREARDDRSFGRGPFVARWRGLVRTETSGQYLFEARSNGASMLSIDGHPLLSGQAGAPGAGVALSAGSHVLELLYEWEKDRARLNLYWTPPSGRRELIPSAALSPERRSWPLEEPRPVPPRLNVR